MERHQTNLKNFIQIQFFMSSGGESNYLQMELKVQKVDILEVPK
jgi:hypothetical protein